MAAARVPADPQRLTGEQPGIGPAFGWGASKSGATYASLGACPSAWSAPTGSEAPAAGTWGHYYLRPDVLSAWGSQFHSAERDGAVLTPATALNLAEGPASLVVVGPAFVLLKYGRPPSKPGVDHSSKSVGYKGAGQVGYLDQELYTGLKLLNPPHDANLNAYTDRLEMIEFPADVPRLRMYVQSLVKAGIGANCFDDFTGGIRDARLQLKPDAIEREEIMRQFEVNVEVQCFEKYLDVKHAGQAAADFCITRVCLAACFVLHRAAVVFAKRDLKYFNLDFLRCWRDAIQADEASRGKEQVTRDLIVAMRLCGYSCNTCHVLGGSDNFCKNPKCTSAVGAKTGAKTASEPGGRQHFTDSKTQAARDKLGTPTGAVNWSALPSNWAADFVVTYATKHSLGKGWSPPAATTSGKAAGKQGEDGPGAYWNKQSTIGKLKSVVRAFDGVSSASGGWSTSA